MTDHRRRRTRNCVLSVRFVTHMGLAKFLRWGYRCAIFEYNEVVILLYRNNKTVAYFRFTGKLTGSGTYLALKSIVLDRIKSAITNATSSLSPSLLSNAVLNWLVDQYFNFPGEFTFRLLNASSDLSNLSSSFCQGVCRVTNFLEVRFYFHYTWQTSGIFTILTLIQPRGGDKMTPGLLFAA